MSGGTHERHDHTRYEELAVGHALHALEPEDELRAVEHLRTCDRCRRLAADTEAVGAELAVLAPPVQPPAELGERLRAAVAAEPRSGAAQSRTAPPGPRTAAAAGPSGVAAGPRETSRALPPRPGPARSPGTRPPRAARGRGLLRSAPWLVTAAAVAALAVVTGWGTSLEAERDELTRAAQVREQVLDSLADPTARVVRLDAQEGAGGTAGAAVLLDQGGRAYVVVDGLAPNDPESTYVLWQVPEGGAPEAVGVFDVAGGEGPVVAEVGAVTVEPERLSALAVSREQGRVAPATPSTPLLVGTTA